MNIIFKKIHLHNFMSFENQEIKLYSNGFTFVSGKNNYSNDLSESNGSGKSSIWEAISWCLTGETIRGSKEITRRNSSDGCYVQLEFSVDNDEYNILRSKDHIKYKTNLIILVNEQNKSGKGIRDSEKLLQQYIPNLSSKLIGSVIILGQGLPARFTNNTPSGRKEILEQLSNSDFMLYDIKERINERYNYLKQNLDNLIQKQMLTTQTIQSCNSLINQYQIKLDNLDNIDILNNLLESTNLQYQQLKNSIIIIETDKTNYTNKYNQILNDISQIELKYSQILTDKIGKLENDVFNYSSELSGGSARLNYQKNELKRLKNISDICPTCGQKISGINLPDTANLETEIQIQENYLSNLYNKLDEAKQIIQTNKNNINKDKSTELYSLFTEKDDLDKKIKECSKELYDVSSKMKVLEVSIQDLQMNIQKYNDIVSTYNQIIAEQNTKIQECEKELLYINNDKIKFEQRFDIINKFQTYVKRDFRGYLLKNIVEFIQNRVIDYSNFVFESNNVAFSLDGNNISIKLNDKEYESLSGGEKQKIDIILQFSIRDMLQSYMGFSSNILVLDEITDNLDQIGCNKVLSLISEKLIDIDSVYIISHRKDLSIPYDNKFIVTKNNNGISEICYDI